MGGGDLNSKKSWHPNTIKNQERVWKAEQAAANEKKRIVELQRERAQERDRAELNELAKRSVGKDEDRLHWMYDKPDKKGQQEDYLLGRAIDKNYDKPDQEPAIPAVGRRVVGSSMLNAGGDSQVDLARKVREDPLILIKERERAARAALLNNPLHRRKITELLKKDQEQQKEFKSKKKAKDNDLDSKLTEKLNALGGKNNVDLAALLALESSSDSSIEVEKKKKKKKEKKSKKPKKSKNKKKLSKSDSEPESPVRPNKHDDFDIKPLPKESIKRHYNDYNNDSKKKRHHEDQKEQLDSNTGSRVRRLDKNRGERSECTDHTNDDSRKRRRNISCDRMNEFQDSDSHRRNQSLYHSQDRSNQSRDKRCPEGHRPHASTEAIDHAKRESKSGSRKGLSAEEAAARLAEMAAAGAEREQDRALRVAQQRAAAEREQRPQPASGAPRRPRAALPDSLEARIHSNRHYIQRDQRHMDTHFARR